MRDLSRRARRDVRERLPGLCGVDRRHRLVVCRMPDVQRGRLVFPHLILERLLVRRIAITRVLLQRLGYLVGAGGFEVRAGWLISEPRFNRIGRNPRREPGLRLGRQNLRLRRRNLRLRLGGQNLRLRRRNLRLRLRRRNLRLRRRDLRLRLRRRDLRLRRRELRLRLRRRNLRLRRRELRLRLGRQNLRLRGRDLRLELRRRDLRLRRRGLRFRLGRRREGLPRNAGLGEIFSTLFRPPAFPVQAVAFAFLRCALSRQLPRDYRRRWSRPTGGEVALEQVCCRTRVLGGACPLSEALRHPRREALVV